MRRALASAVLLAACAAAQDPVAGDPTPVAIDRDADADVKAERPAPASVGARGPAQEPGLSAVVVDEPPAMPASPTSAGPSAIEATLDGEPIELAEAIAAPSEDGTALLLLRTVARGCSILAKDSEASVTFGMLVPWEVGTKTDVRRLEKVRRPYAVVFDGLAHEDGSSGRSDPRWNAKGTVERLAPREPGGPPRVRVDLDGECCSLKGEIDVLVCEGEGDE